MTNIQRLEAGSDNDETVLRVTGLKKHFGGVKALDGVDFSLRKGEVHALVGENGAGKSTLIRVLTGVHTFKDGAITLGGASFAPQSPQQAKARGVQVVHQELNLLSHLSVAENISIEALPRNRFGLYDRAETRRRARLALDAIGLSDVDVDAVVSTLGIAHRQLIEIARALQSDSAILILDEPTATLTDREKLRLFDIVRAMAARGVTVVFVTHHLDEVFAICQRVTVFRNGKTIITQDIPQTSPAEVVRHMVGREVGQLATKRPAIPANVPIALSLKSFRVAGSSSADGVSLDLRYGEILGIAGLVGSGRTELLRGIFAIDPVVSGTLQRDGVDISLKNPAQAIAAGIGFVTEDRKDEGLILSMPIAANTTLANMNLVTRLGLLRHRGEASIATEYGAKLQLKFGKISDAVSSLSGGNQQKVVLAKWLATAPRVLMLDEPTRGVDVGAKAEIYAILRDLADQGMAILVVSSELPELMTLCDRILVMAQNAIQGCVMPADYAEENILKLAYRQS
ncbi:MAG: sugar ABC transporter ATP-binding protein [Rhodobacteraceae bacterium]|nr:sugar ABC transporter ATP-binding protein [Paracoccaceae bacterium]